MTNMEQGITIVFVVDDSESCFEEYRATGNLPQKKIRTIEIDLTQEQLKKLDTQKGESISATYQIE